MTVSYTDDVATAQGFVFIRLLARWRGSVYKLLWKDLLVFLAIYYLLHILYMTELSPENKKIFEALVDYCSRYGNYIPLSFVLGFFVSNVMGRWWKQYQSIPWSTSIAVYVSSTIHGYDEVGRAMRRTIMRYVCLSLTMVFRVLSPRVKKRFPKMSDMVDAGLIHHNELAIIEDLERKFPGYSKNFLPIVWAATIVTRARKEGRILDDFAVKTIIESLNKFRGACGELMTYNTISIPLVYTQVVTIAVYTYFITSLMGQQYIETKASTTTNIGFNLDFVPILIILQFIFYMGWLKVAETLMNPFGEDDDDFDVNSMIDRNLQMSYIVVDEMHNEHPELLKDQYWDGIPQKLPDLAKDATEVVNTDGQDIVDYEVVKRRSTFFSANSTVILPASDKSKKIDDDVEQGHASHKLSRLSVTINPDLIPRASVVSGKFVTAEIMKQQNILDRQMDQIRRRAESLNASNGESDDETTLRKF